MQAMKLTALSQEEKEWPLLPTLEKDKLIPRGEKRMARTQ